MSNEVQLLSGPPPAEVPLSRAPLVRVIAQVRFAPILAIRNPDKVADFQEAIRATYPHLTEERFPQFGMLPHGGSDLREVILWRFLSSTKSLQWRVSLGVDFVALETGAYLSRDDFLSRFQLILDSVEQIFRPSEAYRVGLRYIDRVVDEGFDKLHDLIKPSVLGIFLPNAAGQPGLSRAVQSLLTEAHLEAEEGVIQARWGRLPAGISYDLDALEPLLKPSWAIDLDMFSRAPQAFMSSDLLELSRKFAQRNYSVFREMVTDEFLNFYGGKL